MGERVDFSADEYVGNVAYKQNIMLLTHQRRSIALVNTSLQAWKKLILSFFRCLDWSVKKIEGM